MDVWEGTGAYSEARTFCELWGIEGTVLVDESGELVDKLAVRGVPTNILVDEDGTITTIGASTPHELEAAVRELLGPDTPLEEADDAKEWHWETEPEKIGEQLSQRSARRAEATGSGATGSGATGSGATGS